MSRFSQSPSCAGWRIDPAFRLWSHGVEPAAGL